jgi:glutathione S-transferase
MYELLDQHRQLDKVMLAKYGKLIEYLDRFEKLPKMEAYMKSERFLKAPMNNRMAKFGNT